MTTSLNDHSSLKANGRRVNTVVGTELRDVTLRDLDRSGIEELTALVADRGVVFARDQKMTLDQQVAFGRELGTLMIHPAAKAPEGYPEVLNVYTDADSDYTAGNIWHTDVSCEPEPPALSMLRLERTPPAGGDTVWSSMYAAYEQLSPSMQEYLLTLTAIHSGDRAYRGRYNYGGDRQFPRAEHPVVRTHPISGRKCLYVNMGFTSHIVQLKPRESRALLNFLFDHIAYGVQFQVRFQWEPHSVAIWDNRCVQHHSSWDYYPETRHGFRVTTQGEAPFLAA